MVKILARVSGSVAGTTNCHVRLQGCVIHWYGHDISGKDYRADKEDGELHEK